MVRKGMVTLVTSTGLTDAVYYREHGNSLTAANSLPLLLASVHDQLNPHFPNYQLLTTSLQAGLERYVKIIPTTNGQICRIFVRNLRVTSSNVEEIDKPLPPSFRDFSAYRRHLFANYEMMHQNIRDLNRRHRLDIISTQSRGYDTTAVNTVASKYKLDKVFTIAQPKEAGAFIDMGPRSHDSDDGSEICAVLGLEPIPLDRYAYSTSFEEEYLFYSAANRAEAVNFLGIKQHLNRVSVMLTGVRGDVVWATDNYYRDRPELLNGDASHSAVLDPNFLVSPQMIANDLRGPDTWLHGLSEISLRWGLIQLTPIYIGDRNRRDIFRISMSDELEPWRLGGAYDRPIGRRIAEEIGGIRRDAFGQRKMATTTEFPMPPVPVGVELRNDYFRFLRENRIAPPLWELTYRWVHSVNERIVYHAPHRYRYLYYAARALSKVARRRIEIHALYRRLDAGLYCFCVNKVANHYEGILSNAEFRCAQPTVPSGAP